MLWLWILLAVMLLLALLCRTRVGVWAAFGGETLRLDLCAGPLRIHILPAGSPKPQAEKPEKKRPAEPKKEKPEGAPKPRMSIAWEDVKDALQTLLPPLGRALRRARRGVRIKPLRLSLILGGQEDPADSARLYGGLQALVWGGMPHLEALVDIPEPSIHMDVDFTVPETAAEGEIGVTFRIGTLLAMGFSLAVPALKWFLRWRKRCRTRPPKPEKRKKKPGDVPPEEPKEPAA